MCTKLLCTSVMFKGKLTQPLKTFFTFHFRSTFLNASRIWSRVLRTKYLLLSRKSTDIGHGSVHQDTIAGSRSTCVDPGRRQQTLVGANRPKILQVKLIARCRGSAQQEELPTPSRGNSGNERAAPWSSPSRTRTLWTMNAGKGSAWRRLYTSPSATGSDTGSCKHENTFLY